MVIFCEECGEKYILPQQLSTIPAEFKCRNCHDIFKIPQSVLESSQTEQVDKADERGN